MVGAVPETDGCPNRDGQKSRSRLADHRHFLTERLDVPLPPGFVVERSWMNRPGTICGLGWRQRLIFVGNI